MQVQKMGTAILEVSTIKLHDEAVVYFCEHNDRWGDAVYLGNMPKGIGGRKLPTHEKKRVANIRKSIKQLRRIIRRNFGYDKEREAHVTLTYHGVMTDTNRLYTDFKNFFKRLRRNYSEHNFDYIAVMEPHGHGGWHIHMLLKSDKPLWMTSQVAGLNFDKVRKMWRGANGSGAGGTYHSKLDDVEDFGAYFAAYFTTVIPLEVELSGDKEAIKAAGKAAVKGSRLHFYPAGFRFYRCSAGIEIPKSKKKEYGEVKGSYGVPVYEKAYVVAFEAGKSSGEWERMQFIQVMDFDKKKGSVGDVTEC